jgi:hypothetical protein
MPLPAARELEKARKEKKQVKLKHPAIQIRFSTACDEREREMQRAHFASENVVGIID